jgi:glycosyltransferase involved in cell wall biosynthesis
MPSVLHVTDRWGGGIAVVIQQYVEATSDLTHYLLCHDNEWKVHDRRSELFEQQWPLPASRLAAVGAIRETLTTHGIDVVHAHSSHAGALARWRSMPARVVYTPNAFALLAKKRSREWILGQSERILGLRPIVIAAAGTDEVRLAHKFSPRSEVLRIFNLPDQSLRPAARHRPELRVVMAGRISAQKDPDFFAEVASVARKARRPYSFQWLGDGDIKSKQVLTDAGVHVTGWLPIEQLHAEQGAAQVHLHTARFEGSCLSVLDAAALGLPTIGRPVPGVQDVPWVIKVDTPVDAFAELDRMANQDLWLSASQGALSGVAQHNPRNLRRQLLVAYGVKQSIMH